MAAFVHKYAPPQARSCQPIKSDPDADIMIIGEVPQSIGTQPEFYGTDLQPSIAPIPPPRIVNRLLNRDVIKPRSRVASSRNSNVVEEEGRASTSTPVGDSHSTLHPSAFTSVLARNNDLTLLRRG